MIPATTVMGLPGARRSGVKNLDIEAVDSNQRALEDQASKPSRMSPTELRISSESPWIRNNFLQGAIYKVETYV